MEDKRVTPEPTIQVTCNHCGTVRTVKFTPNEFFTEKLFRGTSTCDIHHKPEQLPDREFKRAVNARLPYPDA